jgi:hypothetical protein
MFPLASPPPDFALSGSLPDVAEAFVAHVAAEQRRSWVAPSDALRLDEHGRLSALHYPPAALEEEGLRALLVYYNERFPRATPLFRLLTASTAAVVFEELFDASDARLVKVCERNAASPPRLQRWNDSASGVRPHQVYGVTPPTYATDYDVAGVVRDVAAIFGGYAVPCELAYVAGPCDVTLALDLADFDIVIDATDRYGEEVARVRVRTKEGVDLGDPLPSVRKRKSAANGGHAGLTIAEGIATKIGAAPDFFQRNRRAS